MEIRNFRKEDIPAVVDLWNSSLIKDNKADWYMEENLLTEERLENKLYNPNSDPGGIFVAYDGREIVGFGKGAVKRVKSYEDEKLEDLPGYLEALVVEREHRRKGTGTKLLCNIESFAVESGKDALQISFYFPAVTGVPVLPETPEYKFLLNRGFKPLVYEMKLKLKFKDFTLKDEILEAREKLEREGIEIRYFEAGYRDSFSEMMQAYFPEWWHGCFRQNLEREKPLPVLVAVDGKKVVGFTGFVYVEKNKRAGFAPGVDPEYRKRGIGRVLVNLWAKEVKEMGAEESLIETATDNYSAQRIYFEMGYKKIGEFCGKLEKSLKCS
ncbi:MAG TPA: GNAT family N-acetyltransferase [bacterium]|nr:GNAT family N-acetyltransferase [bacterium]